MFTTHGAIPITGCRRLQPEGPKILRHGDYYHMLTAVGGTAGPPTGHMVIAARSRSIHGPWEHHPGNPLVRTITDKGRQGHALTGRCARGSWWAVYHGYRANFWTLGRQCLLDPWHGAAMAGPHDRR
jgi:beta-xylosidase